MSDGNTSAAPRPGHGHLLPGLLKELHRFQVKGGDRHARFKALSDVLLRDAMRATDAHLDPRPDGVRL